MSKYKIGDRVIGTKNYMGKSLTGVTGRVRALNGSPCDPIGVEWDRHVGGHSGNSYFDGKAGHCWFVPESYIEPAADQKIVITTDGPVTLARLYEGDKVVKRAEAKCSPKDTYDFATGANLAYQRLMDVVVCEPCELPVEPKKGKPEPTPEPIKLYCVKDYGTAFSNGKTYKFCDGKMVADRKDHVVAMYTYGSITIFL